MNRRPPRSTRTAPRFPDTTRFRSVDQRHGGLRRRHGRHVGACRRGDKADGGGGEGTRCRSQRRVGHHDVVAGLAAHEEGLRRGRSEEPTSELQSLMRNSYAVFCLKKKTHTTTKQKKTQSKII